MKKTAASSTPTTSSKVDQAEVPKLHIGREIADTTWRMTIPVVIFAFIGIYVDIKLGSRPWLTLLGVIVGFYFAVILIKKQIQRSEDSK